MYYTDKPTKEKSQASGFTKFEKKINKKISQHDIKI